MDEQMQNAQAPQGTGSGMTPSPQVQPKREGSLGPVVGIVIIVAVLALGALYYWSKKFNGEEGATPTPEEIINEEDATTAALGAQSSSDTTASIEEDLNATELDNLDQELGSIEAEFGN